MSDYGGDGGGGYDGEEYEYVQSSTLVAQLAVRLGDTHEVITDLTLAIVRIPITMRKPSPSCTRRMKRPEGVKRSLRRPTRTGSQSSSSLEIIAAQREQNPSRRTQCPPSRANKCPRTSVQQRHT
jgi:hypothetical protein